MDPLLGFAVHFTRGEPPEVVAEALENPPESPVNIFKTLDWMARVDDSGYRNSLSILGSGHVRPTSDPLGVARGVKGLELKNRAACFSKTALDSLGRLIEKRSVYGVGFQQDFLYRMGGQDVTYVRANGARGRELVKGIEVRRSLALDSADPFWEEARFTEFVSDSVDWSWEEELRVPNGLDFDVDDPAFLFVPEDLHDAARTFFREHREAHTGPGYQVPLIDPRWDRLKIERALR